MKKLTLLALAGLGLASSALAGAGGAPEAGSLLVFSEFDNRQGVMNIMTVTNTNDDVQNGTIDVHYNYVNKYNCLITDRVRRLTANDTLSTLSFVDNPNAEAGYLYVYARSRTTGRAVKFDWLAGSNLVIDGLEAFEYSTNPWVFKAGADLAEGDATDLDADGRRDFDGAEYEEAPDQILVPRFFGQTQRQWSELVLINLTGGDAFDAVADFLVYNDNEEVFSAQYQFRCWKKVRLSYISNVFTNWFLLSTNHNPYEIQGAPSLKTGWFRIDGNVAFSTAANIPDPALLAVLVEGTGGEGAADLPFVRGSQGNGQLVIQGPFAD